MGTINQCRVKEVGTNRWRVEWLPTKDAKVGNITNIDSVVVRENKIYKDTADYEIMVVYNPAMPEDIFKKQDRK